MIQLYFGHAAFAAVLIIQQIEDVVSTNAALRQPDVVEVGDAALGLGNVVGWAHRRLGRWWWLVKVPLIAVLAPLLGFAVPWPVEPALVLLLATYCAYFHKIIKQNWANAQPREEGNPTCRPMP